MKTFFHYNFLALVLAAVGLSLYFTLSIFFFADANYYESNMGNLRYTAEAIVSALPDGALQRCFEEQAEGASQEGASLEGAALVERFDGAYRITLIRPDGVVLADSRLDSDGAVNHADRPEVQAALLGQSSSVRRISSSLGTAFIYTALPVYDQRGSIIGVFRVSQLVQSFWLRLSPGVLPFLGWGLLVILAIFGALYAFSRALAKPLGELAAAALTYGAQTAPPVLQSAIFGIREFDLLDRALRSMAVELKARIEKAQAEGRRLTAILDGMDEAVLALDKDLRLCMVNPRAGALLGIDRACSLPHSLLEAAKCALLGGQALERELRLHIDGKSRYFRLFAAPLDGSVCGVVMVLGDLTRLHKLERIRQDFAANVSHELRTPIQLIKGFSETLLETSADQERLRWGIEIIRKNALTMENLTTDLLTLVSLEDEEQPRPEMRTVVIEELLDEAVRSVEPVAAKKNIRIARKPCAGLAIPAYGHFMVQALINLLDNAVKYSPAGSEVEVEASITGAPPGGTPELSVTVTDHGIGIPIEHQSRIFERFYRVDTSRSREQGGTGLGLAIVRHIVLLHRGSVEVESHAGEGSAFTIRIPAG
ncbi:MAG: PAS domain-containing protein [Treponema sp.]|nr:PAS domain-containing protein [Treponema sp.]